MAVPGGIDLFPHPRARPPFGCHWRRRSGLDDFTQRPSATTRPTNASGFFSQIRLTGERLRAETAGQGEGQKGGADNDHSRHGTVLPSCVEQHKNQPFDGSC